MQTQISANFENQVLAVLNKHGVFTNHYNYNCGMTREQAEDILFAEIEKGKQSGGALTIEEVFSKFGV